MTKKWPKREGDIKAIFLVDEPKKDKYSVFEQNETNGPWYEGSVFRKANYSEQKGVGKQFFVYHYYVDGNGGNHLDIVGIANKSELPEKIYNCAVDYCKKEAKAMGGKFINKSSRAEQSKLETAAQKAD